MICQMNYAQNEWKEVETESNVNCTAVYKKHLKSMTSHFYDGWQISANIIGQKLPGLPIVKQTIEILEKKRTTYGFLSYSEMGHFV